MTPDETLAAADGPHVRRELTRGAAVGRYVILSELGAGGMGVVYAAYDPELDRKVAIKLLRASSGKASAEMKERLLREAQALAKLSDPHVVGIHDVGTHGDEVWLAMEFVDGQTLSAWSSHEARSWRDVLEVMVAVGLGLAAAHGAGLVHRDVKPDNVMIGRDGRVRVMDFGLARGSADAVDVEEKTQPSAARIAAAVTRAGTTPGTPAYMAPEQITGEPTDGRTDQFAYCVTMWEALYGRRPFAGDSGLEVATNVLEGARAPTPRRAGVPGWLSQALDRGLSHDPSRRWPSMLALVEHLRQGRRRVVARRVAFAGLGVVAVAGAFVAADEVDERRRVAACEAEGAAIEEVLTEDTRAQLRAGLLATGAGHAAVTADKLMPWLDDQVAGWRQARTEACLDARLRETWDEATLERARWCLDDRRFELEALVERLREPDLGAVNQAVQAAADLSSVAPCRDAALLGRQPTPPEERRAEIDAVRAELAQARALEAAGAYGEGVEVTREILGRAEATGWAPLMATAQLQLGDLLEQAGDFEASRDALEAAYFTAARSGAMEIAIRAADGLVATVGYHLARYDDALRWSRHADVARQGAPDPQGLRQAEGLDQVAVVEHATGNYARAIELQSQAAERFEAAFGPEHPRVAASLNNLANTYYAAGDHERAAAQHRRVVAIWETTLGAGHPQVAMGMANLAESLRAMGSTAEALQLQQRALAIARAALGEEHDWVARIGNNLADSLRKAGKIDEARPRYERSLAIWERIHGPDHPQVALALHNLALVWAADGDHEQALALLERSREIFERRLGPEHPNVGQSLTAACGVYLETGALDEAASRCERALTIVETALGPAHVQLAEVLVPLASIRIGQGRAAEAVTSAQRAVALLEATRGSPRGLARARFILARASVAAGRGVPEAVALARAAREVLAGIGAEGRNDVAEIDAWLDTTDAEPTTG